jgi:hypothetical protein
MDFWSLLHSHIHDFSHKKGAMPGTLYMPGTFPYLYLLRERDLDRGRLVDGGGEVELSTGGE